MKISTGIPTVLSTVLAIALMAGAGDVRADDGAGKDLYRIYCTQCHGLDGTGGGVNAAHMAVQPRDHTDPVEMSARTDADLFKAIKHGGKSVNKSVLMPSWEANLGDDEINAVIAYLRDLCCNAN